MKNDFESAATTGRAVKLDLAQLLNRNQTRSMTPKRINTSIIMPSSIGSLKDYAHGNTLPPSTKWLPKPMNSAKKDTGDDDQDVKQVPELQPRLPFNGTPA